MLCAIGAGVDRWISAKVFLLGEHVTKASKQLR